MSQNPNENTRLRNYLELDQTDVEGYIESPAQNNAAHTIIKTVLFVCVICLSLTIGIICIGSSSLNRKYDILGQTPVSRIPIKIVSHVEIPTSLWGAINKPYPTGAFWTNLVVKNGDGPVGVLPYGIKCLESGIQVSYGATRRSVSQLTIYDQFLSDLQLSATQTYISRSVDSYDTGSVTMSYRTTLNGKYRIHLVKGSPFVTVVYEGATPVISANIVQIINVEAKVVKGSLGIQYIVTLGNYQKWLVYCSEPIAFTWKDNSLYAPSAIRGMVRVAFLPPQNVDNVFNLLLAYVQRYPIGIQTTMNYLAGGQMTLTYSFLTQGIGQLLMLMLPHQSALQMYPDCDESKNVQSVYSPIYSIKGKLKPVVGDNWKLLYNLAQIGWNYALADKFSNAQLDSIAYSLQKEVKQILPVSTDTYSFGKELGRMARLALIADNLGIADARQIAVLNLENALTPWLLDINPNYFVYDKTWGGVVSNRALGSDATANANADYGLGWYNDHHFHYGYFVYAFAVLARLDPVYWEPRRTFMELLVRDICSYETNDPDFPYARHKDFFDGHSWASGLFQQANGKNQESSSEAVNAYYACYLYGLATANTDLSSFAQSLLTMEMQSAQTYWHMRSSDIYDAIFASNRMVGNVGALDVTASTWFGSNAEYVNGINMMPVTPALAALMDQPFVEVQYPALASRVPPVPPPVNPACSANPGCAGTGLQGNCCPTPEGLNLACCDVGSTTPRMQDEWRSLIFIDRAVVDRESAWTQIMSMNTLGSGNSKANALFWAASRPPPRVGYVPESPLPAAKQIKAACAANSACDALGIQDDCCPTATGMFLSCCPRL